MPFLFIKLWKTQNNQIRLKPLLANSSLRLINKALSRVSLISERLSSKRSFTASASACFSSMYFVILLTSSSVWRFMVSTLSVSLLNSIVLILLPPLSFNGEAVHTLARTPLAMDGPHGMYWWRNAHAFRRTFEYIRRHGFPQADALLARVDEEIERRQAQRQSPRSLTVHGNYIEAHDNGQLVVGEQWKR